MLKSSIMGYLRSFRGEGLCQSPAYTEGQHLCITATGIFHTDWDPVMYQAYYSIYFEITWED